MTIRKWIANNFLSLIIIILGLILIFQNYSTVVGTNNYYSSDTVIVKNHEIHHGETVVYQPTVRDSVVREFNTATIEHKVDTELIAMVKHLQEELLKVKKYSDTLAVDTIGHAYLDQEVSQNIITKQKIAYNLKIPKFDTTITNTKLIPRKNIWLVGGSLEGNKQNLTNQINADLMLITKKDKGYKIGTGIDLNGQVVYRFGLYWKL